MNLHTTHTFCPSLLGSNSIENIRTNVNDRCNPGAQSRARSSLSFILFLMMVLSCQAGWAQWQPNPYSSGNISFSGGNVGIGIINPASQLHLASNQNHALRLTRSNGMYGFQIFRDATAGRIFFQNTNDSNVSGTRIMFDEGGGNWQNVIMNPDGGNVGIGTSNPSYRLHVNGGGFFQQRLVVQGDIPNDNNAAFWNYSSNGYGLYSQGGTGSKYSFHFLNKDGGSILYGRGDGNIGIGSTNPTSKLTVKGTVHAEEVKVDLSVPGPDYVFEENYPLQSLEDIESYINQNKHLPEVPSASEMEKEGIKVGEMNMLLLKKVEELTLHLIEANKKIETLTVEMKELKRTK